MRITEFIAGELVQQYEYKSFQPNTINHAWLIDDSELIALLTDASNKLGELNAFSQLIPDVDFFIKMHVAKEGTESSKIEGTQTNIDEAMQKSDYIGDEQRNDWQEVHNYIDAMNYAIASVDKLPLSSRLLRDTHKHLLQGVRGASKLPGEFRKSQNWIGGKSIAKASFVPPYFESINDLMTDLEKFLHSQETQLPDLIKVGMAHYQFETIHPFLDGNGRIGRLLITLYLVQSELLVKPTLYLSEFFEKNRYQYYDLLTNVRTQNELSAWLIFFLKGVKATAENSIQVFKDIIVLRKATEDKFITLGKKQPIANKFLKVLWEKPIVDSSDVVEALSINKTTAFRLIEDFIKLKILIEKTGQKRNRLFVFDEYLELFRS